jgi:L-ascorbate metabolism protein UlaG (beta-lactamase superfamily)
MSTAKADILALTHKQEVKVKEDQLVISTPGEYEAKLVTFKGIAARAHMDEEGKKTATMYRIDIPEARIGITGHIHPDLSDEQLEALGTLDVLIVPVGGNGYTLDAEGAARVARAVEPKVIIPTHYAQSDVKYEVPQAELQQFLDEIGAPVEEQEKYKIKGDFPDQLTIITLKRADKA